MKIKFYFNLNLNGTPIYNIDYKKVELDRFIEFIIDIRLFYQILKGPRYAHWDSVEAANLLRVRRKT